ncbi:MAG: hypothetical protein ACRD4K_04990 [Candidatus Acidiferrales bacterium]
MTDSPRVRFFAIIECSKSLLEDDFARKESNHRTVTNLTGIVLPAGTGAAVGSIENGHCGRQLQRD